MDAAAARRSICPTTSEFIVVKTLVGDVGPVKLRDQFSKHDAPLLLGDYDRNTLYYSDRRRYWTRGISVPLRSAP